MVIAVRISKQFFRNEFYGMKFVQKKMKYPEYFVKILLFYMKSRYTHFCMKYTHVNKEKT